MSSIRSILDKLAIAATFYGISDKNTKPSVDQALKEIEEAIKNKVIGKNDDNDSFKKLSKYRQRKILIEYDLRVKQLSNLKELLK